ncbi:MAG: SMP-30/gluconolactonase/LRE family protein [Imperialibacter sp.]|uniref:SMP-30/gluconolactonase/LRE family protein n=1 Tax=Imperialibacter sp. TaxID=2038411 RepID=UPI0032EE6F71
MRKTLLLTGFIGTIVSFGLFAQDNAGSVAFTIPENDLLPESIAYDPGTDVFYVGSTRRGKIIKIEKDGSQSTFVEGGQFGQWMVIGIKIDPKRNELWFCSSGGTNLIGYDKQDDKEGRPAGIFRVNLSSGELIKKYTLEENGEVHFFNDLVIHENGDVYASHMFNDQAVYKIDRDKDQLEPYVQSELIKYPNGMDISDDGKTLFVAHSEGIAKVSLASGKVENLAVANSIKVSHRESIDGLYVYKNSLIGIQSDLNRVTQFDLSVPQGAIVREKILQENDSRMDHPTTGVLVGDVFYYVANAQFQKVNENGSVDQPLSDPTILKLKLK